MSVVSTRLQHTPNSADSDYQVLLQINALNTDVAALITTVNAIITAAATNIGAVAAVTPNAAITAKQIGDGSGTAYS